MKLRLVNIVTDDLLMNKIRSLLPINESDIDEDLGDNIEDMLDLLNRIIKDDDELTSDEILHAAKFYRSLARLVRDARDPLFELLDSIKTFGHGGSKVR